MIKKAKKYFSYKVLIGLMVVAVVPSIMLGLLAYYYGKILPVTYVLETRVDGLTPSETVELLRKAYPLAERYTFIYSSSDGEVRYDIPLASVGVSYDYENTTKSAYNIARSGNVLSDLYRIVMSFRHPNRIELKVNYDDQSLSENLGVIAGQVSTEPVYPSVKLVGGEVIVDKGKAGKIVDTTKLKNTFLYQLGTAGVPNIEIQSTILDPSINEMEQMLLRDRAQKLASKSLTIVFENGELVYDGARLVELVTTEGEYRDDYLDKMIEEVATNFEREAQNPAFVFTNGRVEEFKPALAGIRIKDTELRTRLIETLNELEMSEADEVTVELPVEEFPPEFETSEVNNLGIKELIGRGTSTFRGSIASRVYNINLAATRLNGALVKPGEVFSFNSALGDVSKLTGYKEAYVIQDGKTILGDGGGVCQVSTTLFRAVLDAGLPIIERRAHTYRVGYYEQGFAPGLDATVYSPTTDFKFKNDTGAHILIQATPDTKNLTLVFELYGTSDGRVATTTKPVITESTPPPDDVYIDDPSLPTGQVKQIEYKAWGAKVVFNYSVVRNNETIYEKTFYSVYKPWGAVYMRGTAPVN